MNNKFYFLRHAATQRDPNIPISNWRLSEKGEEQIRDLTKQDIFDDTDIVISSTERKAYQTAKPFADKLKKEIIQIEDLSELNRDLGGFMQQEEYKKAEKDCLGNFDISTHSWETASHALDRFSKKIEELDKKYENKKILIVGHGYTINLYFAKVLGVLNEIYERTNSNSYADWGVIKNGKVTKDIATN